VGAFDIRSPKPRATALASMARGLALAGHFDHPALDGEGWWREKSRFSYPPYRIDISPRSLKRTPHSRRPIVITGATGTLGSGFARLCAHRGLEFRALSHAELDITDPFAVEEVFSQLKPWAVVNAAGYVRVDDAEWDSASCYKVNTEAAVTLGVSCAARGIQLATFSSDLVFDGASTRPYVESDPTNPLGVYGASKAECEEQLCTLGHQPLIVRTSAFFGPWDSYNFLTTTLGSLSTGVEVEAADDTLVSPTYVPDLVNAVLDLLIDGERGIWHLANRGETTWADFARRGAHAVGLDPDLVVGSPLAALNTDARRPLYSVLGSERGMLLPSLDDAISRYAAACPKRVLLAQASAG
jgi:dTDP-4-dehydrorhamnose reductase